MSKILERYVRTKHSTTLSELRVTAQHRALFVNELLAQEGEYRIPFTLRVIYDNQGWREYAAIFGKTKKELFKCGPDKINKPNDSTQYRSMIMPYINMLNPTAEMRSDDAYCDSNKALIDLKNFVEFMVSGKHRAELQVTRVYASRSDMLRATSSIIQM